MKSLDLDRLLDYISTQDAISLCICLGFDKILMNAMISPHLGARERERKVMNIRDKAVSISGVGGLCSSIFSKIAYTLYTRLDEERRDIQDFVAAIEAPL
ncbi:hypothetical protein ACHQM5_007024 [Ranunculus cassubicifolius]